MFIITRTGHRKRVLDIGKFIERSKPLSEALVGLHSFTGCDTVSSFSGKGKATVLNKLSSLDNALSFFQNLGTDFQANHALFTLAEETTQPLWCRLLQECERGEKHAVLYLNGRKQHPTNKDALTSHHAPIIKLQSGDEQIFPGSMLYARVTQGGSKQMMASIIGGFIIQ